MSADWKKGISADDLPEEFGGLAELIGLENVIKTMEYFEGREKYFPKIDGAFRHVRDRVIRARWRKHNVGELAREFNLTHTQIREIVKDHEDQVDLFPRP